MKTGGTIHPTILVALAVVALALSGCGGKSNSATPQETEQTFDPTAPTAQFDDDTCAISGIIMDDELTGIPGASVTLLGPQEVEPVKSAQDGTFTFSNLEPGTYQVLASRTGFEPGAQGTTCEKGKKVETQVQLTPLPEPQVPYTQVIGPKTLHLECAVGFNFIATSEQCGALIADDQTNQAILTLDLSPITGALIEMHWSPTGIQGGGALQLNYPQPQTEESLVYTTDDRLVTNGQVLRGSSPLNLQIETTDPESFVYLAGASNPTHVYRMLASGSTPDETLANPLDDGSSKVILGQNADLIVEYFYNGAPIPAGHTNLGS